MVLISVVHGINRACPPKVLTIPIPAASEMRRLVRHRWLGTAPGARKVNASLMGWRQAVSGYRVTNGMASISRTTPRAGVIMDCARAIDAPHFDWHHVL